MAPTQPADRGLRPTLTAVVERLARLLRKEGYFQPLPGLDPGAGEAVAKSPPTQPEWEFRFHPDAPADPVFWRVLLRYRRPDLCGIEVYDLSDVLAASWRKPLGDPDGWSSRDFGIWGGGRTVLDGELKAFLPGGEDPVAGYRSTLKAMAGLPADSTPFGLLARKLTSLVSIMTPGELVRARHGR